MALLRCLPSASLLQLNTLGPALLQAGLRTSRQHFYEFMIRSALSTIPQMLFLNIVGTPGKLGSSLECTPECISQHASIEVKGHCSSPSILPLFHLEPLNFGLFFGGKRLAGGVKPGSDRLCHRGLHQQIQKDAAERPVEADLGRNPGQADRVTCLVSSCSDLLEFWLEQWGTWGQYELASFLVVVWSGCFLCFLDFVCPLLLHDL